jgi:hypothetical protein
MRRNKHNLKDSYDKYRNIGGVHFESWTSDPAVYEDERQKAKAEGLKVKVIAGELYREKKR